VSSGSTLYGCAKKRENRDGQFESVSSLLLHQIHYVVSKAGIIGLVRCLAAEFGPKGIYVNGFGCGYTPETEGATRAALESIYAMYGTDVSEEIKTKLLRKFERDKHCTEPIAKDWTCR